MSIALVLDRMTLPSTGKVTLQLDCTFELKISAEEARRQVHTWLVGEVSYMIRAGESTLVIGETDAGEQNALWRVPAILTATHLGDVGVVGHVDVEVVTGKMSESTARAALILNSARKLAAAMPPYTPRDDSPADYLVLDMKPNIAAPTGNPLTILQTDN